MSVQAFTITFAQSTLDDLRERLAHTRWPDEAEEAAWDYGTNLDYLKTLVDYWQHAFNWRAQEAKLNQFAQFRADIDGFGVHFIHEHGQGPNPLPLVITHGWPSSFTEMLKILPRLTDPARYGGDPADAFDVVLPSLPGYGFSDRSPQPEGVTEAKIAEVWSHLMTDVLGYRHFGAHGGDIGGWVTSQLGRLYPQQVIGIHVNGVCARPYLGTEARPLSEQERACLAGQARWEREEGAYAHLQHTKPQTLAYGLNDSPAGLAAWIVEKFRSWSDCDGEVERRFTKEELLANISLYWLTQTINSSFLPYYVDDERNSFHQGEFVEVPCAVAMFPKNLADYPFPREWAERVYNVQRWTEMPRGGHFPAIEETELLVEDLRAFFRPLRAVSARSES
jgi:pimeloyl-ACP methyl ester carboxylesterase